MNRHKKTFILRSKHGDRPFSSDASFLETGFKKPVVLFIHGFKGFKDFAFFNVLADKFCEAGFVFVKMNLSRNGTTVDNPMEFADLEAFGNNNYSIELDDIGVVLDHIVSGDFIVPKSEIDFDRLYLMGHSRGGGISIVKASEDDRIKKLVTWASVSTLTSVMPMSVLEEWKKTGVHHIFNSRTKQDMPLYYQIAQDYYDNEDRFNLLRCASKLTIPHFIVHGDNDETVDVSAAAALAENSKKSQVLIVNDGTHTLGGYHPYDQTELPDHARYAFRETVDFLNNA